MVTNELRKRIFRHYRTVMFGAVDLTTVLYTVVAICVSACFFPGSSLCLCVCGVPVYIIAQLSHTQSQTGETIQCM